MRLPVLVAAVAALMFARSASAQRRPANDSARHFAAGREALVAHDYDLAAREFEAAYAISHDPSLLFNLGVVFEDAGRYPDALRAYRRYLDAVPDAPNRIDVERRIRTLGATASTVAEPASPPPSAAPPAERPRRNASARPIAALVVGGAGVAVLGAGVVVGIVALQSRSSLEQMCGGDVTHCPDTPATRAALGTLSTQSIVTDVMYGVGGAAIIAGVLWYALSPARPSTPAVAIGPSWIGLRGNF